MQEYTYVIIGSSAAGISAVNKLWQLDPTASLLCISAQREMPYNTCFLVDLALNAKSIDEISLRIHHKNVQFMFEKEIIAINRQKKKIVASDNSELLYQKLLITTGVRPNLFSLPESNTPGVFTFHTLTDLQKIERWIEKKAVRKAVIVGAGLTGLECADVFQKKGIAVTVIEKEKYILSSQLTPAGTIFLQEHMSRYGVALFLHTTIAHIIEYNGQINAITLARGDVLETDLLIFTAGVRPNSEFALAAGLTGIGNQIEVNECMATSDPSIYAAGDVVSIANVSSNVRGTWAQAVHQGMIAAQAMAGIPKPYAPTLSLINSSFFGLRLSVLLVLQADAPTITEHINEHSYLKIISNNDTPCGFAFIGERVEEIDDLKRTIILNRFKPIGLQI